jgi:hypothetical protein
MRVNSMADSFLPNIFLPQKSLPLERCLDCAYVRIPELSIEDLITAVVDFARNPVHTEFWRIPLLVVLRLPLAFRHLINTHFVYG